MPSILKSFIIFLIIAAVAATAFFYFGRKPKVAPPEKPDKILIKQTQNGQLVHNITQNYLVNIPKSFNVEKEAKGIVSYFQLDGGQVCKFDSTFLLNDKRTALEKIEDFKKKDLPYLTVKFIQYFIVQIEGLAGQGVRIDSVENGYSSVIYVNSPKGLFQAVLFSPPNSITICENKFQDFINGVNLK